MGNAGSSWHREMGPLSLFYSDPVFVKDMGLLFSTLWSSGFALKKYFSPNQEEAAGSRVSLQVRVVGPEFHVVPVELAV